MLFGNPTTFAIQIDHVPDWSSPKFPEGIFQVYLGGFRLVEQKVTSDNLPVQTKEALNKPRHRVVAAM